MIVPPLPTVTLFTATTPESVPLPAAWNPSMTTALAEVFEVETVPETVRFSPLPVSRLQAR